MLTLTASDITAALLLLTQDLCPSPGENLLAFSCQLTPRLPPVQRRRKQLLSVSLDARARDSCHHPLTWVWLELGQGIEVLPEEGGAERMGEQRGQAGHVSLGTCPVGGEWRETCSLARPSRGGAPAGASLSSPLLSPACRSYLTWISSSEVSTLKGRMLPSSAAAGLAPGPHHPSSRGNVSSLSRETNQ